MRCCCRGKISNGDVATSARPGPTTTGRWPTTCRNGRWSSLRSATPPIFGRRCMRRRKTSISRTRWAWRCRWRSGLRSRSRSRPVIVVEGDGALLMHMGALVTVGAINPANLTVLIIQNGVHAASGGQALTNAALDLAQLARAAGIAGARTSTSPEALADKLRAGPPVTAPNAWCLATEPDLDVVRPPVRFDPLVIKHRFRPPSARRVMSMPCLAAASSKAPEPAGIDKIYSRSKSGDLERWPSPIEEPCSGSRRASIDGGCGTAFAQTPCTTPAAPAKPAPPARDPRSRALYCHREL